MKNLLTLTGGILCSALFTFTSINDTLAQTGNEAKKAADWVWEDEQIYRKQLEKDGIPAATIDKLVANRKELIFSGRSVSAITHSVDIRDRKNPKPQAACSDMGGENGWGSWTASTGVFSGITPIPWAAPLATPVAPRFNLTSGPGTDACTPGPTVGSPTITVVAPGMGNSSIQLGQPQTNGATGGCGSGCAEQLTYPLTVTPQDTNFTFSYAVIIEDPNHGVTDQPFVSLCIYDSAGNPLPCGCFKYTAGPSIPGFFTSACNINSVSYYKPWTLVGINLATYVGQTLTVEIVNADCALSGHFAHSYWDFSCGTISTAQQYCVGEDSLLLTAPFDPTFTYSWSTGSINDSIIVNPQITDTVILYINPPSGCGYYQVYYLLPTLINTALTYTINCNTVNVSDNTSITGGTISSWQWNFPGGVPSSANTQGPHSITYPVGGGNYTVSLTVTSQAGCTDTTVQVPITILPPPVINAGPDVSLCAANTTLCASGGVSYTWMPGGATTQCITVNPATTTTYTVYAADANGCTGADVVSVTLNTAPVVTAGPGDTICIGQDSTQLSATASMAGTYSWVPNLGLSPSNTVQNPYANPPSSQTYTVYFTNANGCTDADVVPVNVAAIPFVSAIASTTICVGDSAQLNANTSNGVPPYSYYWSPPNALNNASLQNPNAGPVTPTGYIVTVVDANGCTDDTSTFVFVQTVPSVSWASWTPDITCEGYVVPLNANVSSNGQYVIWDFGDGTSTTTYAPNTNAGPHLYPFNGTYSITVIVHNPPCKDTVDTTLVIGDIGAGIGFCAANVFTPNGDNYNNCFQPALMHPGCNCVAPCTYPVVDADQAALLKQCMYLEVYDRWGIKVFESTDTEKCWDGKTLKGKDAKEGTYYYISKLGEITIKGYVTLLRRVN